MTALEASLLTGVLTGFFALADAFATHCLQRATAQDERIWNRRAETYVSLLQYQGSGMVKGNIEAATVPELAIRDELTAKAKAFAADEVLGLWQKSALAHRTLEDYASEQWPELTTGEEWQALEDAAEKDAARTAHAPAGARSPRRRADRRATTQHRLPSPQINTAYSTTKINQVRFK